MPAWGEMQGQQNRTSGQTWRMPKSAAEGVETRARPRACGDASDDAEDAAAGEGKATLTRTRLGAAARPADADDGEAIAGADVVRVLTPNRCGVVAVFRSCSAFLAQAFLSDTPTDTRNAARSKSSVSRWISVSCSRATTSSGAVAAEGAETRSCRACGDACDDMDDADAAVGGSGDADSFSSLWGCLR